MPGSSGILLPHLYKPATSCSSYQKRARNCTSLTITVADHAVRPPTAVRDLRVYGKHDPSFLNSRSRQSGHSGFQEQRRSVFARTGSAAEERRVKLRLFRRFVIYSVPSTRQGLCSISLLPHAACNTARFVSSLRRSNMKSGFLFDCEMDISGVVRVSVWNSPDDKAVVIVEPLAGMARL